MLDYDTQVLLIHRVGHKKLTPAGLVSFDAPAAEKYSIELENRLDELQAKSPEISTVKVNAIIDFTDFNQIRAKDGNILNFYTIFVGTIIGIKNLSYWLINLFLIIFLKKLVIKKFIN